MKKDKKFLGELDKNLVGIKDKVKQEILTKYENIIKEEKAKKRKITDILKEIGDPVSVAKKEIDLLGNKGKESFISKLFKKKEKVEKKKEDKPKEKKVKKEKVKKEKKSFFSNIFKKKKKEKIIEEPIKEEKTEEVKEEPQKEVIEVIQERVQEELDKEKEYKEEYTFESKEDKKKRIVKEVLGTIITVVILFIWLWISIFLFASIFAFLDGVRFIGIVMALFGLDLLVFWIMIMVNKVVFKRKNRLWFNIAVCSFSILLIALGVVLTVRKLYNIEMVEDVSSKYTMTTKLNTYNLPTSSDQKFYIYFNSNYKTQYAVNYDSTINGKVRIEVKYYECYYDFYVKKATNSVYVSLKLDDRDRLSVYLDDLKDGKLYDSDELSRYTVKITVNPNDAEKLSIK